MSFIFSKSRHLLRRAFCIEVKVVLQNFTANRMVSNQNLKLFNGDEIPALGLGTWKSKPEQTEAAVAAAIDFGYRHIDCAWLYGNEKEVGHALNQKIRKGGLKREDLFITSKLWNTKHGAEDVMPALKTSLELLGLEYLDLYLIHWPIGLKAGDNPFPKDEHGHLLYSDVHYLETWEALEKCVDAGLVKSIGLSNFNSLQVEEVCSKARIQPAVLQVECHPYLNQSKLIEFCKKKNIVVTAYSPLGSPDRPWAKPGDPYLLDDPKIIKMAKKHNKSPAQICIRFQIERGVSVIPKSATPERIKQNSEVFDFSLTKHEMEEIESYNVPWRACIPKVVVDGKEVARDRKHPHFPFMTEF
ncbi:aldo-keto reductase family 1 member A1-A-like isoform X1 [Rhopilema esculentum]|uniref:aldo-keto reductase family 1 member A1-A-like isoform X1 n=1 Tax=Rhopilema esculentum TaxID=499914 RepID=UPI0031DFDE8A